MTVPFRKIGIKIVWRNIDIRKQKRTNAEILAAYTEQELHLTVHLLSKAKQWHPKDVVLGYAQRTESDPGRLVSLFYDRVTKLAKNKGMDPREHLVRNYPEGEDV